MYPVRWSPVGHLPGQQLYYCLWHVPFGTCRKRKINIGMLLLEIASAAFFSTPLPCVLPQSRSQTRLHKSVNSWCQFTSVVWWVELLSLSLASRVGWACNRISVSSCSTEHVTTEANPNVWVFGLDAEVVGRVWVGQIVEHEASISEASIASVDVRVLYHPTGSWLRCDNWGYDGKCRMSCQSGLTKAFWWKISIWYLAIVNERSWRQFQQTVLLVLFLSI